MQANPILNFHMQIKKLKQLLRSWNSFGDINQKIYDLTSRLEDTEKMLQSDWSEEGEKDYIFLTNSVNSSLKDCPSFLDAKAHLR